MQMLLLTITENPLILCSIILIIRLAGISDPNMLKFPISVIGTNSGVARFAVLLEYIDLLFKELDGHVPVQAHPWLRHWVQRVQGANINTNITYFLFSPHE